MKPPKNVEKKSCAEALPAPPQTAITASAGTHRFRIDAIFRIELIPRSSTPNAPGVVWLSPPWPAKGSIIVCIWFAVAPGIDGRRIVVPVLQRRPAAIRSIVPARATPRRCWIPCRPPDLRVSPRAAIPSVRWNLEVPVALRCAEGGPSGGPPRHRHPACGREHPVRANPVHATGRPRKWQTTGRPSCRSAPFSSSS